jgi:hypothetical protein
MVVILTIGALYQVISSGLQQKFEVDPFLAAALIVGALVKSFSYLFIEKKGLK